MKKMFFLSAILSSAMCWAGTGETDFSSRLSGLMVVHAKETQKPSVLSSGFVKSYISGSTDIKWIDIDGVDVAINSAEDQSRMVSLAKESYAHFLSFSKMDVEKSNISLEWSVDFEDADVTISDFQRECNARISYELTRKLELSFITPKPIPLLSVCQFLVYSFSVNGIDLRLEGNQLIAVERQIED